MRKALLIGIDDYPNGNKLSGCVNDVKSFADCIEKNGDGSPNFDVKRKLNVISSDEVLHEIKDLFHGKGEISLFYFSGHGYVDDMGAEIVMPGNLVDGNYNKGIRMSDILQIANKSKVKNKMIILDCCYSGNIGKVQVTDTISQLSSGISILTACSDDESAEEEQGHGLFTVCLCSALNGGAADFSGNITIGGIYAYIDRSFGPWQQRPVFKTNITEFVPVKQVEPKIKPQIIRKLVELFGKSDENFSLDPSFEDTNAPDINHKVIEPYANETNVKKFKVLQQLQSIGFVEPVGSPYMYFAAMENKSCRLTPLGKYYWQLVKDGRI